jgi:very-short-patch-repair endonuclease
MSEFHPILPDKLLFRGRELRKESTWPERRLWNCLRDRRLGGLKFRRQAAIGPFIVDYYCHEHRLVVELDGASHDGRGEYDRDREQYLQCENLHILRFHNDDVLRDVEPVLRAILLACGIDPELGSAVADSDLSE